MTCECQESIGSGWDQDVPVLAFIVYVVIMLWVFLGIAVVCDDHFEAALMTICDQLNLSKVPDAQDRATDCADRTRDSSPAQAVVMRAHGPNW